MGAFDDAKTAAEEASRLKANRQLVHELLTAIKHAETSLHRRKIWKKRLSYAAILGVVIVVILYIIWPLPPPPPPPPSPQLSIAAALEEPSRNGFLDAGETGRIRVTISNKGGTARNVELRLEPLKPPSIAGLTFRKPTMIPELSENSIETVRITMTAARKIKGRDQSLQIQLFGEDRTLLAAQDFSFKIIPITPKPEPPRRR